MNAAEAIHTAQTVRNAIIHPAVDHTYTEAQVLGLLQKIRGQVEVAARDGQNYVKVAIADREKGVLRPIKEQIDRIVSGLKADGFIVVRGYVYSDADHKEQWLQAYARPSEDEISVGWYPSR